MEIVVFIVTAAIALTGAIAMLLTRNAVHSALFLLLTFGSISVLYLLLQAPFLFAVQLIIYAGAIIVLFLFVVMLLGAERDEDVTDGGMAWQRPIALVLAALLLIETAYITLTRIKGSELASAAPVANFASPEAIAAALFTRYLFPFEVTSVILLTAVVGVVVLSRRFSREHQREIAAQSPDLSQFPERI